MRIGRPRPARRPTRVLSVAWASLLVAVAASAAADGPAPIPVVRVACLGSAVTAGVGLPDPAIHAWPAQMGALLGPAWEVASFAVPGATLASTGDHPICAQPAFQDLIAWAPDVVVVALGAEDSTAANVDAAGGPRASRTLAADARDVVARLRASRSTPRVLLCLPPPVWSSGDGVDAARLTEVVAPAIRAAAADARVELVDLLGPLGGSRGHYPDGVHPAPFGAREIARVVHEAVSRAVDPDLDVRAALAMAGHEVRRVTRFEDHDCLEFALDGAAVRVVQPRIAAAGGPWVWRARFFGHEPQFDRAMLERGWHVAWIDVADLFGAPAAIARFERLHALLASVGLSERPVLEAMSRGGLAAYAFAADHPERVAAIYGDNPVLDPRSWPLGFGASARRDGEATRCLAAWGLADDAAAREFQAFPIDRLAPLAAAGVPVLHVVGAADTVVPPAENADLAEIRLRVRGGRVEVIRKAGVDHHPHSLPDPTPIVDFALRATGRRTNPCAVPTPAIEWRSAAAGWGDGTWRDQHERVRAAAAAHPDAAVVFLGDSITQGLTGAADRVARAGGVRPIDRGFGGRALSFGISGDRTEHVLWRVRNGAFDDVDPSWIVLMIGVNNLRGGDRGEDVAEGTAAIVDELRAREPQATLLLLGSFPTGGRDSAVRREWEALRAGVARLGDGDRVRVVDLTPLFLTEGGDLHPTRMAKDGVHLAGPGYEAWMEALVGQEVGR